MKILKLTIFPLIALLLISASCEKQNPEPEFTQYFSCKINGEEWVAKTPASISGPVALNVDYNESSGLLFLDAVRKDNEKNIYDVGSNKIISINEDMEEIVGFVSLSNNTGCSGYLHDSLNPGNIEICRFDKTKREVEGTFNMTLINRDCTDSLMYITDGKFAFWY
jgi:hypothetical protein